MSEIDTGAAALRACPFCGCTDIRETNHGRISRGEHNDNVTWTMACYGCGASVPGGFNEHGRRLMQDRWNARAPEPAQQGNSAPIAPGVEALRERVAAVIDPEIWGIDGPTPTRSETEDFHKRRRKSGSQAVAILALLDPLLSATAAQARRETETDAAAAHLSKAVKERPDDEVLLINAEAVLKRRRDLARRLVVFEPLAVQARRNALEEAANCSDQWSKPSVMLLAAGEMTAGELRTAQAVAKGISAAIRALDPRFEAQEAGE